MNVVFSLQHRGALGAASRARLILSRFGATAGRMERCLERFQGIAERYGARPTFPATACVLARHPSLIRRFVERGTEIAIHGLVHDDHAVRDMAQQLESLVAAERLFEDARVPFAGFRAPYLRYNTATVEAVRLLGFRYDSSQAVAYDALPESARDGPARAAYERVLALCDAQDADRVVVRPRLHQGLVRLPVALPDDECMIERLQLDPSLRTETWLTMLESTYRRADLFTLQLHPERVFELAEALEAVLAAAASRQPSVWVARLDEIASWWRRRSELNLNVAAVGEGRYRVSLTGDRDCALILRGLRHPSAVPWYGREELTWSRSFEVVSATSPILGVSPGASQEVLSFLREEGIPFEISSESPRYGTYLEVSGEATNERELLRRIEESSGPLLRLARWPSGARSALALTGDIDAITLRDFAWRVFEVRPPRTSNSRGAGRDV